MNVSIDRSLQKPQDYASDGSDAIGFVQFWGNSPALNLLADDPQASAFGPAAVGTQIGGYVPPKEDEAKDIDLGIYEDVGNGQEGDEARPKPLPEGETINVLISAGADVRHVVKSLARRPKGLKHVRFYLHEKQHEVLARHLLFLQIVNNKALTIRERMEVFLSLYGNTLVRERDCSYVSELAPELVELITENSAHPLAEKIDLSQLKFKDRDILQEVFKGWFKDVPFDVEALREQRCRGFYRARYDYRKNLMDYDYQTFIKEVAGIIHWFHYKQFGHTGVAFETRLASYASPNRTLASYTEAMDRSKGNTVQVRGYWGDIVNSPYHGFCTRTDPEVRHRLFKINSQQYRHTETDIAEYNLTAYISELETGQRFSLPPEKPEEFTYPYASPLDELRAADKVEEVEDPPKAVIEEEKPRQRRQKKVNWPPLTSAMEGVEIVLLAGDPLEVLKKPKYRGLFHRAFIGAMGCMPVFQEFDLKGGAEQKGDFGAKREESVFASIMAEGGEVIFETLKYQAHFEGMTRLGFRHRVAQAAHLAGWRLQDERRSLPKLEKDMQERQARAHERNATDFLRFVVMSGAACEAEK